LPQQALPFMRGGGPPPSRPTCLQRRRNGAILPARVWETDMKPLRALVCIAAIAAAAGPALAADLLFHAGDGEEILANFDGKPYWELQAMCAGHHGATANYFARQGERAKASASEAAGVAALNDAVRQIRHDRNLDEAAATKVAEPIVQVGGRATAEALRTEGTRADGRWNYWRSFCIDAGTAFRQHAN
jgi:hypothetical protein